MTSPILTIIALLIVLNLVQAWQVSLLERAAERLDLLRERGLFQ